MRQTTLTQSGAPGRVIGWTNFTLALNILILSIFYISMDLSTNYFAHFSGCRASFVCSCHSILECCVTFSGVKLSIRSFVLLLLLLACSQIAHQLYFSLHSFCCSFQKIFFCKSLLPGFKLTFFLSTLSSLCYHRRYIERRAASENCKIDNAHCTVFSF